MNIELLHNLEVLFSIHSKYCEPIISGKKVIEVRKKRPKLDPPFVGYIYCTKSGRPLVEDWYGNIVQTYGYSKADADKIFGNRQGKVIGRFICDRIDIIEPDLSDWLLKQRYDVTQSQLDDMCLTEEELWQYGQGSILYGLHITNLGIYDTPKGLSEFRKPQPAKCFLQKHTTDNSRPCSICPCCTIQKPPQSWCYVKGEV